MNKRILVSLIVVGVVGASVGVSSLALFNDQETSADNQFTAGELDLRVDWRESYNGEKIDEQELTNDPGSIFNFKDVKPGDHGKATISLHLEDNPGWIWMNLNQTSNWDNACTEPEYKAEKGSCGSEGELDEELEFVIWSDDGDGVKQENENVIFKGTADELEDKSVLLDGNSSTDEKEAFNGEETGYVGVKWKLPLDTGNRVQGDSVNYDIKFYTEQRRHNDNPDSPWKKPSDGDGDDNSSDKKEDKFYKIDLAGGEPIEDLSESTYHQEGRMQRYAHGGPDNLVDNETEPDQVKTGTGGPDCVDSEPFQVDPEQDTVKVEFEILNKTPECGTGTELSLVTYKKPFAGWKPERADELEMFDNKTHRFHPGNHSLEVEIPDVNDGESTEPGDDKPSAEFDYNTENTTVTFDASDSVCSDSAESIESYEWDFGDGNTGTGEVVEHTYSEGGTYDVELTVTDTEGKKDTSTQQVTVEESENSNGQTTYTAVQGNASVELQPFEGNMTVQELYGFNLPERFDHDNQALNGAFYPESGSYYESTGTYDLQQESTSIMFLYDGPNGLSLVVVHDKAGGDGGSATWEITDLPESGQWVVKDDLYLKSNGEKATTNYDDWDVDSNPQTINWTWGGGGTDGGAYQSLGNNFSFTIDPAFNEESPIYEEHYNGDIDEWQVLSGDRDNPDRTTLELDEPVQVSAN